MVRKFVSEFRNSKILPEVNGGYDNKYLREILSGKVAVYVKQLRKDGQIENRSR